VVATCRLPFKVDLESLARLLPGRVKLNPRYPKYRGAYVRVEGMKGIVTVFDSGAMIGIGSRSAEDAERPDDSVQRGPKYCKASTGSYVHDAIRCEESENRLTKYPFLI
jgi:TATA-box binding protein (TBP) (component of TFIID and TFIIIB)